MDLVFKAHTHLNMALQFLEQAKEEIHEVKRVLDREVTKNPEITLTELCRSRWMVSDQQP